MSATKRRARRRTAWCFIRRVTTTRSNFIACMGFNRTISEGSRDADRRAAGEGRLRFITLAAPLRRSRAHLGWGRWPSRVFFQSQTLAKLRYRRFGTFAGWGGHENRKLALPASDSLYLEGDSDRQPFPFRCLRQHVDTDDLLDAT